MTKITNHEWDTVLCVLCTLIAERTWLNPAEVLRLMADRAEQIDCRNKRVRAKGTP